MEVAPGEEGRLDAAHHRRNPLHDLVRAGERLADRWEVVRKIGGGGFGQIYLGREETTGEEVGVKVETLCEDRDSLTTEAKVLRACQDSPHFPRFYGIGKDTRTNAYSFLVMELLSLNLSELRRQLKTLHFSGNTLRRVGLQCVDALHHLHLKGFIHRDVKPSNWGIGLTRESCRVIKIIDFGLARRWRNADGSHKEQRSDPGFRGTVRYASVRSHHGLELGRMDDLASLWYMLIELGSGGLPWRREKNKDLIGAAKTNFSTNDLVDLLHQDAATKKALRRFYQTIHPLEYAQEPRYTRLKAILLRRLDRAPLLDWEDPAHLRLPL